MAEARRPCVKCGRNRAERFFTSPRGRTCSDCRKKRVRTSSRDVRLQETYGISECEYQAIFTAQGGVCAICKGKRTGNLDVDHNHAIERELVADGIPKPEATRRSVRGLLCRRCNRRLLPAARDDERILGAAAMYLTGGRWSLSYQSPDVSGLTLTQGVLAERSSCS